MRYLMSVIDNATGTATPAEMAAIDEFNAGLVADGYWVLAAGLAAPSTAMVVDHRREKPVFTDGPFIETKEYLSGFWIIEVPDDVTARRLAAEGSRCCNRSVELRSFL